MSAERQDGQNKDGLHGVWEKENLGARLTIKNHQPHKETRKLQFKIHIKKKIALYCLQEKYLKHEDTESLKDKK